jgi:outer membrane cobalamin receptor
MNSRTTVNCLVTIAFAFLLTCILPAAYAQTSPANDLGEMSLEDLLNVKIQGAAHEKRDINSTPAAVTVIDTEQIRRSGARDLRGILNLVPGIAFASDTQGIVGIVVRGIWAHEGKALLLIDGEEMNELSFSTTQFGHHYPADAIARVEVIRGPGSATHGGFGELAVINVITKGADDFKGMHINSSYGQTSKGFSEGNIGVGLAGVKNEWKLSSHVYGGRNHESDKTYTDTTGNSYNFSGNSKQDPLFIDVGASTDKANLRFIYDHYNTTDKTAFGQNASSPIELQYHSLNFGASYRLPMTEGLTLTPEFHFKRQMAWYTPQLSALSTSGYYYNVVTEESTAKLTAREEISQNLNVHLGFEYAIINAFDAYPNGSEGQTFPNQMQAIEYNRSAAFTEINWDTELARFTIGGRYETQNAGGSALVPRLAALKEFGDFHIKALYSWGFREPGIENLRYNPQLKSETTKVSEIEMGYRLNPQLLSTINIFSTEISNPIIYFSSNGTQGYANRSDIKVNGLEWDNRYNGDWGFAALNYSYSHPIDTPSDYQVAGQSGSTLGIANNKLAFLFSKRLFDDHTRLNVSEVFYSPRYGYDYSSTGTNGLGIRKFGESYMTNLMLERSDFFVRGLTLGLGVDNLLNEDFRYVQPYVGQHPPIPGQSREWLLKISYRSEI